MVEAGDVNCPSCSAPLRNITSSRACVCARACVCVRVCARVCTWMSGCLRYACAVGLDSLSYVCDATLQRLPERESCLDALMRWHPVTLGHMMMVAEAAAVRLGWLDSRSLPCWRSFVSWQHWGRGTCSLRPARKQLLPHLPAKVAKEKARRATVGVGVLGRELELELELELVQVLARVGLRRVTSCPRRACRLCSPVSCTITARITLHPLLLQKLVRTSIVVATAAGCVARFSASVTDLVCLMQWLGSPPSRSRVKKTCPEKLG